MKYLDNNGLEHLWNKIEDAIEDTTSGSSGGGGGISTIKQDLISTNSEVFNVDENNPQTEISSLTYDGSTIAHQATGDYSHVEGCKTYTNIYASHVEGYQNQLVGDDSKRPGVGLGAHVEGAYNKVKADYIGDELTSIPSTGNSGGAPGIHVEGKENTVTALNYGGVHVEGRRNTATNVIDGVHIEGQDNQLVVSDSSRNNAYTRAMHIEGCFNKPKALTGSMQGSHIEGYYHTLEFNGVVGGDGTHVEGYMNKVTGLGMGSHIEGGSNIVTSRPGIHVEGCNNTASGNYAHVEGYVNEVTAQCGHAEGIHTICSSPNAHVEGQYNIADTQTKYAHICGNGSFQKGRSNAYTLDWDGNGWYAGTIEPVQGIILHSSTAESTKKFLITVDDSGTLAATEIMEGS